MAETDRASSKERTDGERKMDMKKGKEKEEGREKRGSIGTTLPPQKTVKMLLQSAMVSESKHREGKEDIAIS